MTVLLIGIVYFVGFLFGQLLAVWQLKKNRQEWEQQIQLPNKRHFWHCSKCEQVVHGGICSEQKKIQ